MTKKNVFLGACMLALCALFVIKLTSPRAPPYTIFDALNDFTRSQREWFSEQVRLNELHSKGPGGGSEPLGHPGRSDETIQNELHDREVLQDRESPL